MYPIGSSRARGAARRRQRLARVVDEPARGDAGRDDAQRSAQTGGAQLGPDERVDLAHMLAAYTIGGARLMHQEAETGSIEVGKSADLVVLDRNLFAIPPAEIAQAKVLLTLFEGKLVYEATR